MTKDFPSPLSPIELLRASNILRLAVASSVEPACPAAFRAHRECEVCIVKEGDFIMNVAGKDVPLKQGDFLFILPYVSHAFKTLSDSACHVYYVHFNLDFLNNPLYQLPKLLKIDLHQYFMLYAGNYIYGSSDSQMESCICNIEQEYKSLDDSPITMLNYYVFELILLLSRKLYAENPIDTDFRNTYVERATRYIHNHYAESLTVADVAAHLKISERYLSRVFYQSTRTTVLDYINSYRINKSILLMLEGHSFTQIALQVGFCSPPHYSKVFKKYMGLTPREYKKALLD